MIKRIIGQDIQPVPAGNQDWLNLDVLAQVEVTSEDAAHPIESALLPGTKSGWRAAESGPQTVRLRFEKPQRVRRIQLQFAEDEFERTQQFVLRWSSNGGESYREIVRQQYNFSPPNSTNECEDYRADLDGVTELELNIVPDISGGAARASLAQLNLA
jgi:F5/8 type C domain-containing protein